MPMEVSTVQQIEGAAHQPQQIPPQQPAATGQLEKMDDGQGPATTGQPSQVAAPSQQAANQQAAQEEAPNKDDSKQGAGQQADPGELQQQVVGTTTIVAANAIPSEEVLNAAKKRRIQNLVPWLCLGHWGNLCACA